MTSNDETQQQTQPLLESNDSNESTTTCNTTNNNITTSAATAAPLPQAARATATAVADEQADADEQAAPVKVSLKLQTSRKRKRVAHHNTAAVDPFGEGYNDDNQDQDAASKQQLVQLQLQQQQQQEESLFTRSDSFSSASTASSSPSSAQGTASTDASSASNKLNNNNTIATIATTAGVAGVAAVGKKERKVQQPDGWRVKLYRLNADGSWDDCGTGRVLCLYRPASARAHHDNTINHNHNHKSASASASAQKSSLGTMRDATQATTAAATTTTNATSDASGRSGGSAGERSFSTAPNQQNTMTLDARICQELGEPTLCMHAEIVPGNSSRSSDLASLSSSSSSSSSSQPRILLRTRILLRDAYQRQGDNIITWCEPYYADDANNRNNVNAARRPDKDGCPINTGGVDLALSFQDNAGCLDIWKQITHVQRRAAELYRAHQQQHQQQQQELSGGESSSSVASLARSDGGGTSKENNSAGSDSGGGGGGDDSNGNGNGDSENCTEMPQKLMNVAHAEMDRHQPNNEVWVSLADAVHHHNETFGGGAGDDPHHHSRQQHHDDLLQHNNHNNMIQHVHHDDQSVNGDITDTGGNNQNNTNKLRQLHQQQHPNDAKQQQQQQHVPFGTGEEGSGDMYGGSGTSSPSHQLEQCNLQNSSNNAVLSPQLPNPPTLSNLEEIADTIARVQHAQQRESLAIFISQNECSYLKLLLRMFPAVEARGDFGSLATLAACVKTILLLNDPSILELIVSDEIIFEEVCATLEYDPDLRDKANHRWFLRERARFRTVVLMEDEELISAIHRAFRVNYLRDNLLRPTMDESSLSTLSSLETFTHADVVKGVTVSPPPQPHLHGSSGSAADGHGHENGHGHHDHDGKDESAQDSYLVRVIRVLGVELHALCHMEWAELESMPTGSTNFTDEKEVPADHSIIVSSRHVSPGQSISGTWQQHLAPQDGSLASRRIRRRGCLTFLRELFNMVRVSLQQSDKDNFFSVIVSMEVEVMSREEDKGGKISDNESQTSKIVEVGSVAASEKSERFDEKGDGNLAQNLGLDFLPLSTPVNLLSLLGTVLSDPNTDITEKGLVLEIIAGVAMHDPSLIRRHCLEFHSSWKRNQSDQPDRDVVGLGRPEANEKKQVIFLCPPNDLLAALLFLLDTETDAGILLQVSEIMRIILDTDMMGEHGPMGAGFVDDHEHGVFADEMEGIPPGNGSGEQAQLHEQHNNINAGCAAPTTEQKQFLAMFYEHFIDWVVAPFQFTILHPVRRVPDTVLISPKGSPLLMQMMKAFQDGVTRDDGLFRIITRSAIRASFAVELLTFCVRAHLYRMKIFLLKSRVLSSVLKLLNPRSPLPSASGDRCLKLAALRFLRAILSVNDEFYHRHIIHHDLFAPVFEAFRANPVGDNLVSSAIVEMCDFIQSENIMSLMEYIVTKHLSATQTGSEGLSLEDASSPYVSTFTTLRESYEQNLEALRQQQHRQQGKIGPPSQGSPKQISHAEGGGSYFSNKPIVQASRVLSGKALEDQRKFREDHDEESYFEDDDDDDDDEDMGPHAQKQPLSNTVVPPAVDEVAAQEGDNRVFALLRTEENDINNNQIMAHQEAGD